MMIPPQPSQELVDLVKLAPKLTLWVYETACNTLLIARPLAGCEANGAEADRVTVDIARRVCGNRPLTSLAVDPDLDVQVVEATLAWVTERMVRESTVLAERGMFEEIQ